MSWPASSNKEVAMKAMVTAALLLYACVGADDPEVDKLQQSEIIEVHGGCPPGTIGNGTICVDQLEGGGTGGGGDGPGPVGGEGGPIGGGGGGGGGAGGSFDPEPDRNKDRHSCDDWCVWDHRQCDKECWHRYPNPVRDFWTRTGCLSDCNKGETSCRGDCQKKFPGRPIATLEP